MACKCGVLRSSNFYHAAAQAGTAPRRDICFRRTDAYGQPELESETDDGSKNSRLDTINVTRAPHFEDLRCTAPRRERHFDHILIVPK